MVETTEVRDGSDPAFSCDWSSQRRIFVQRQMSADTVVVIGIRPEHAAQMRLAENDQMVQALSSDRSDQPFKGTTHRVLDGGIGFVASRLGWGSLGLR